MPRQQHARLCRCRALVFALAVAALACSHHEPAADATLSLGKEHKVAQGKIYAVAGTKLRIQILNTGMASAQNAQHQSYHFLIAKLKLSLDGTSETHGVTGEKPLTWHGFKLSVNAGGFSYGKGGGTLRVDRAP